MIPTQSPTLASRATAELPGLPDRAPRLHRLKTDPEVYQAVLAGRKTFEIRLNDRDFRIGDELLLMETTFTGEAIRAGAPLQFTGNEMRKRVSHVLSGYGLMPGWVCLSFAGVEAGRASRAQSEWQPIGWQFRFVFPTHASDWKAVLSLPLNEKMAGPIAGSDAKYEIRLVYVATLGETK